MIRGYQGLKPRIAPDCFIAETADIIGDVRIAAGGNIWYNATLRGDVSYISIGKNSNVQDNCCLHVDYDVPTILGDNVTVGHGAIIHAATVEDNCLIGMGAIVLDYALIGQGSIIGAGAVVPPNMVVPPNSLVMGVPGKVVKKLTAEREQGLVEHALKYVDLAADYK